jgi:hypothetical protein
VAGLAVDRLGLGLDGGTGIVVVAVVALAGWVPFAVAAVGRRTGGSPEPETARATEGANA